MRGFACHRRYRRRGALLPHLFTLTLRLATSWLAQGQPAIGSNVGGLAPSEPRSGESRGGMFSVPLSVRLPCPGVTRRTALWSSDFPPAPARRAFAGDRLSDCDLSIIKSQGPNPKTRIPIPKSSGCHLNVGIWSLGFTRRSPA